MKCWLQGPSRNEVCFPYSSFTERLKHFKVKRTCDPHQFLRKLDLDHKEINMKLLSPNCTRDNLFPTCTHFGGWITCPNFFFPSISALGLISHCHQLRFPSVLSSIRFSKCFIPESAFVHFSPPIS